MDITKCVSPTCSVKHHCLRFLMPCSEMQSVFIGSPGENKTCTEYIPYEGTKTKLSQMNPADYATTKEIMKDNI